MTVENSPTLQGTYLNDLRTQQTLVQVYLISGVKLIGRIESFDRSVVLLRHGCDLQILYKQTISTVMPTIKPVKVSANPVVAQNATGLNAVGKRIVNDDPPAVTVIRKVRRRVVAQEQ